MQAGQGSESPINAVSRLISLLAEDCAFTSVEIAETLWLATKLERPALTEPEPPPPPEPALPLSPPTNLSDETFGPEPLPPASLSPQANIATPTPQAGVLPPQTLPVWLADPAMLTDALAVIRALRPLLRTVDTRTGKRLDEPATVETIARTRLCLPVLAPEQRPHFDIILVVDRSSSMHIWQRLIKDVMRILKRYGLFWNVRVFDLAVNREAGPTDDPVLLIANPQRPGHRPSELIDQRGQRIALVMSDCTAVYWWDGTLLPMLQSWGAIMPTAVWQVLPPWMWRRTALGRGTAVALANDGFGGANQWLKVQRQDRDEDGAEARRLPLPVLTSDLRDLARWSRMVAGDRRELTPGFLLPQAGGTVPRSKSYETIAQDLAEQLLDADPSLDPDSALNQALTTLAHDRVERFLELASPEAQRLIMLLAAASVITLPVVRLIRDAMLDEVTSPLPVAEVFLSGLLQRLPGQADSELERAVEDAVEHAQANPDELDPVLLEAQDLVQYDFVPGVRPVLLEFLPPVDTIDVVNSVSAAVERRWNAIASEDFRAFLTDPTMAVAEELQGMRSFASVTADILEPLGGDYAQFAQALRRGAQQQPTTELEGLNLNDFPLQDFEYEVAEFVNFPSLEPFEFIEAHFRDAFPPTLQLEEFTVITLGSGQYSERKTTSNRQRGVVLTRRGIERLEAAIRQAQDVEKHGARFTQAEIQELAGLSIKTIKKIREATSQTDKDSIDNLFRAFGILLELSDYSLPETSADLSTSINLCRTPRTCLGYIEPLFQLGSNIPLHMVLVPSGTFLMGSPEDESGRGDNGSPQHEVRVPAFFMGRYPVTQAQWRVVAALPVVKRELQLNPSAFKGKNRPVEKVSWHDAVEFCDRLSTHTGRSYRLPSEAEWEYACRAGTTSPFYFGEILTTELANYNGSRNYLSVFKGEFRKGTTLVDYFGIANAFGISDMHGNVYEWCQDHWRTYEDTPFNGSAWVDPKNSPYRIVRGGSWEHEQWLCRSAYRDLNPPHIKLTNLGFRLCCSAPRGF